LLCIIISSSDNGLIIQRWRRRLGKVAVGIFKSYAPAVVLWKSIMPVGGRVAGKGVGVHNSGGSSDGKYYTDNKMPSECVARRCIKILNYRSATIIIYYNRSLSYSICPVNGATCCCIFFSFLQLCVCDILKRQQK